MKGGAIKFRLSEFIINESFIKMFFESSEKMPLEGIGYVKNFIEVSNDEIKREALRFSGACASVSLMDKISKEICISSHKKSAPKYCRLDIV